MELGIRWRRSLLARGVADGELRRWLRTGELVALRRGAYAVEGALPAGDPAARHRLQVFAALPSLARNAVVSHMSAAVMHGIPLWAVALDRVHVTRPRRSGARVATGLHVHSAALDRDEVVMVEGVPVTSPSRTVADLGRWLRFEPAVVVVDAALHRGLVTADDLAIAVARAARRPGIGAARRAIAFGDPLSESVGESRSRVKIMEAGLPTPHLQHEVVSSSGFFVGKVDFWWEGMRTVGEFDGRVKYGKLLRPGQSPGDAVFAEKVREDRLRAEGLTVVRWIWRELDDFAQVAHRLRRAFDAF
jgi:hypothetical protein